jgi:hypothetical protein
VNLDSISAADYGEHELRAVRQVLVEIGQVLGSYRSKFVVIGGAVPWLLLTGTEPPHIGTLDIDLNLNPEALGEGEYASLVSLLEAKGYERGDDLRPFQLRRRVDTGEVGTVSVLVDLLMPRESRPRKNRPPLVPGLRVQGATGGSIALRHFVDHVVHGVMPDGRPNSVHLQVASIPALLVMKGYALAGRDKMKDAYDIYYCVRNYTGGFDQLVEDCLGLLEEPEVREGFEHIAAKFGGQHAYGPITVRRFLESSGVPQMLTPEQIQTDAYFQVHQLLAALELAE